MREQTGPLDEKVLWTLKPLDIEVEVEALGAKLKIETGEYQLVPQEYLQMQQPHYDQNRLRESPVITQEIIDKPPTSKLTNQYLAEPDLMSTSEVIKKFLDYKKAAGLQEYSLKSYRQALGPFAREFPILPTSPEEIEKFLASKPSASTRKWIYTILSGLYKYAFSRLDVPNVMEKIPKPITRWKEPGTLTKNQVRELLDAIITERERGLVYLYLGQGLRLSEAVRLDISDVGEDTLRVKGKEREETMPLLPEVREILLQIAGDRPLIEPVFISQRGRRLGRDMAEINIKQIFKRANVNSIKQSPHTFRHTFATIAIAAGCDTYSVERLLRHRSTGRNVTFHYIHLSMQELRGKLEKYSPLRIVTRGEHSDKLLEGQSQQLE